MTTAIDYALLAGVAYRSTRDPKNRFPIPTGWIEIPEFYRSLPSGFEAVTFTKGSDIVISYAGTGGLLNVDWIANFALTLGAWSDQLGEAAAYYLQVKALNPNATISFTGHSLGGGLASLMSVFFGGNATTFDQAPFAASATAAMRDQLVSYLEQHGYTAQQLVDMAPALMAPDFNPAVGAMNVTNINVAGEALSLMSSLRIGIQIPQIEHGDYFGPFDLHSQSLLSAFLQSQQTAATGKALNNVTVKLTDLLKMIFDSKLYYNDPNNTDAPVKENFLERLVKHEAGNGTALPSDAMVTRFTSDLWKLAQEGGMTLKDGTSGSNWVSRGLTAFAMQKYYEEKQTSAGYKKELFTDLAAEGSGSAGIRFDMADVSDKFATALANNEKLTLSDAKGFDLYLKYYFDNNLDVGDVNFTAAEDALILSMLPYMRDWYVQAGLPGMIASDANGFGSGAFIPHSPSLAEDKNLFEVLGGVADDYLTGGSGADLLVGNAANDNAIHIGRIAA